MSRIGNIQLKASKPLSPLHPKALLSLGDHIRKVRLERNFSQPEVAKIIGVTTDAITYWENNRNNPRISHLPKAIEFLGYNPLVNKELDSIGERLLYYRQKLGLSRKLLAKQIGLDEGTLMRIEEGKERILLKTQEKLKICFMKLQSPPP